MQYKHCVKRAFMLLFIAVVLMFVSLTVNMFVKSELSAFAYLICVVVATACLFNVWYAMRKIAKFRKRCFEIVGRFTEDAKSLIASNDEDGAMALFVRARMVLQLVEESLVHDAVPTSLDVEDI